MSDVKLDAVRVAGARAAMLHHDIDPDVYVGMHGGYGDWLDLVDKVLIATAPFRGGVEVNLTKPQKRALAGGTDVGCIATNAQLADHLVSKGLAVRTMGWNTGQMLDWTPFGLEVRTRILADAPTT